MATRTELALPGIEISAIEWQDQQLVLNIQRFFLYVALSGSAEQTQWSQSGRLVVELAEVEGNLPVCPCTLLRGDIHDNQFLYRDQAPLPLDVHGEVAVVLTIADADAAVRIAGERIYLDAIGDRKYITHVRP